MNKATRRVRLNNEPSVQRMKDMTDIAAKVKIPTNLQNVIDAMKAQPKTDAEAMQAISEFSGALDTTIGEWLTLLKTTYRHDEDLLPPDDLSPQERSDCAWVEINLSMLKAQFDAFDKVLVDADAFNADTKNKDRKKKAKAVFSKAVDTCYAALYAQPIYQNYHHYLNNYKPEVDGAPSPAIIAHELVAAWASSEKMGYVKNNVSKQKPTSFLREVHKEIISTTFLAVPDEVPAHEFHNLPSAIRGNTARTNAGVTDGHRGSIPETKKPTATGFRDGEISDDQLSDKEREEHGAPDKQAHETTHNIAEINDVATSAKLGPQEKEYHTLLMSNIPLYHAPDGGNIAMATATGWSENHVGVVKLRYFTKMKKAQKKL